MRIADATRHLPGAIMEAEIRALITEFAARRTGRAPQALSVRAPDPWALQIHFSLAEPGQGEFAVRNLREGDVRWLLAFGQRLGALSRDLFSPYPWGDEAALEAAFRHAIRQSVERVDASYLLFCNGEPVGHFFLWKAGGNPHSLAHGVQLPELGVAIADAHQGQGLGSLAVRLLQIVARTLRADGIQLTTAMSNAAGWNTYLGAGFEYVGITRIPLDVDVTAVLAGEAQGARWRDERLMVYVINEARRDAILRYLGTTLVEGA